MNQNALFALAAIVLVVAALSLGFTYYSISSFKQGFLTGYVTANGTIAINITSAAAINFSTSSIDWRNGTLNAGTTYANLSTSSGTVVGGTWLPVSQGLVVDNIGNVNVSVNIVAGKTNQSFIGGTGAAYKYNITNNEAGSCINATISLGVFYDVNTTQPGTYACSNLSYTDSKDSIKIDIFLGIPYDAPATSANLTDQIMITATQSAI